MDLYPSYLDKSEKLNLPRFLFHNNFEYGINQNLKCEFSQKEFEIRQNFEYINCSSSKV